MVVKNLNTVDFNDLVTCFLDAFENYFVQMPTEPAYYRERWRLAKVDLNYSYGMFDNNKLVGFVLHAIDNREGVDTAFNAGTGVLPAYRGRRIVQKIYEYARPLLAAINISVCRLEVITENETAIAAYHRIGFKKNKRYKCYRGAINSELNSKVPVQEIPYNKAPWDILPNQDLYSWENQQACIANGPFQFFWVLHNDEPESFFIIDTSSGYLPQFDLLEDHEDGWDRLLKGISQVSAKIKINNVDERLTVKISQLNKAGLENHIDQYEMMMEFNRPLV